ncbi:MAG: hypothetical protein QOE70_6640 [Chthoniobacter sp.]|jgi:hypothetical protein|nr:hypothetical protein [Chthoniobacter sp.]
MNSFLDGRPVVSPARLPADRGSSQMPGLAQPPADSTVPPVPGYSPAPKREHGEKKIETVEVDGIVQMIIVTCGCGEKIEVHCGY